MMPGNGKRQPKKKEPAPKEKKGTSSAEVRADNKASGQQGMASAAAVHASYGQSTICHHRMKAEIYEEFLTRNKLELDNAKAGHNRQIYQKFTQEHALDGKSTWSALGEAKCSAEVTSSFRRPRISWSWLNEDQTK